MGTGFDFTRLDDDFFLAAPDFSANAKLAASADLLPSGDYRFHILGSRFLGDRRCGHLGFDLIVCDGTFAGSHSDLSFYIYHPLTRIRRRACLGGAPLENAAMFHGREFTGSVWNYRFEGLPASKIVRFYYPDGTWPGMDENPGRLRARPLPRTVLLIAPGAAPSAPPQSNYKKRLLIKKFIIIRSQHAGLF
mgnify:FL=1